MKKIIVIIFLTLVSYGGNAQVISVSDAGTSYAICTNGNVISWGGNFYGLLGNGTTATSGCYCSLTPGYVSILTEVKALAYGDDNTLALKDDGTVWTWGQNSYGQLGLGDYIDRNIPTQITSLSGITSISGGDNSAFAFKNDGTVWAWGNNYGITPVQVNVISNITKVKGSFFQTLAIKDDSTVWAWGDNNYGELGNGTFTSTLIPVQVIGLSGIIDITTGYGLSFALKKDGTVWAWGSNTIGQLGLGNISTSGCHCDSLPQQLTGLSDITAIAGSMESCYALKNNGTVWAWGRNDLGQLGDGTNINRISPVQVIGLTGITEIAYGLTIRSLALKSDGTLWSWGSCIPGNGDSMGVYNIPVQANYLCTVIAPHNTVSVSEISKFQPSIQLFPNPATSTFTITTTGTQLKEIKIMNVLGEIIGNYELGMRNEATIDISGLDKGIYFVQITDQNKIITNRKIVKQ